MTQLWNPRPWIRWIILEIQNARPIFQLLSALAVLIVISELFTPTDKTPQIVRNLGVLVLLPLGFKAAFIYLLFCGVCIVYEASVESSVSSPPRTALQRGGPFLGTSENQRSPLVPTKDLPIPLPGAPGWKVYAKFSLDAPHVLHRLPIRFYNFRSRAGHIPSQQARHSYTGSHSAASRDWRGRKFALRGWDVQLRIMHQKHHITSVYEFSLKQIWHVFLPSEIPLQLRKGGAGGLGWWLDAPKLDTFLGSVKQSLVPRAVTIPHGVLHDPDRPNPFDYSYIHTDITQVCFPIIFPVLKRMSFGSFIYGGVPSIAPFQDPSRQS